jgi:Uma2 family endonuclease
MENTTTRAPIHVPETYMTRDEFVAWYEQQPDDRRYERINGIIVAKTPQTIGHVRCKMAACMAFNRAIKDAGLTNCEVLLSGMLVPTEDNDLIPDGLVRCGPRLPNDAIFVPDPVIVVEVVSPDTETLDRTTKRHAYFQLPSVRHYLLVWPNERRIVRYTRLSTGSLATDILTTGPIYLDPPSTSVTVEEFYTD